MSNYLYQLNFIIKTALTPQFEYGFGKIMEAQMNHKMGVGKLIKFYRTFMGGKDTISVVVSLESLGEMDKWKHTPEIILEYFGEEEGSRILQLYCDAMESWTSCIMVPYDPLTAI